ncbi:MAG: hypothetical protein AAF372_04930 [Pseudomonadota bacterium]
MDKEVIDKPCVFALTQISNQFDCDNADLVTRRSGPDISCTSEQMSPKCAEVYEYFKRTGLDAFEFEDDLTQVPHGVWVKIQFGGLLGLHNALPGNQDRIENISALVKLAEKEFGAIESIPYAEFVKAMKSYNPRKRKK